MAASSVHLALGMLSQGATLAPVSPLRCSEPSGRMTESLPMPLLLCTLMREAGPRVAQDAKHSKKLLNHWGDMSEQKWSKYV